jgi:glyoxylase-like metal-dependent hydrolase (beta-lactamase superfamily II)
VPDLAQLGDAVRAVDPGQVITVGALPITCLHTPGHTRGSQCLACGGAVFTGDTLFVNACGRCDLPGGDAGQLFDSLHTVLGALDDATVVYPGHHYGDVPVSSLGRERANNPYLQLTQRQQFVAHRSRPR